MPASSPLSLEGFAWAEILVTSVSHHHSRAPLRLGLRLGEGFPWGRKKRPSHVARKGLRYGVRTGFRHPFTEEALPNRSVEYGAFETL